MQWIAIYKDGSRHTEAELDTTELIDRSKLAEFRLLKDDQPVFIAYFPEDGSRKLIFRRRKTINMDGSEKDIVYLVGWHENVNGKSVKAICYINKQGLVEFDGDRNNLELVKAEL